jgi:hypothetical protein
MIRVMKSSANGRYLASNVMMKNDTLREGLSWEYVYAYASVSAGRKVYAFKKYPASALKQVSVDFS